MSCNPENNFGLLSFCHSEKLETRTNVSAFKQVPVTIRRKYITGNVKINQLDLINPIYIYFSSRYATVDNDIGCARGCVYLR